MEHMVQEKIDLQITFFVIQGKIDLIHPFLQLAMKIFQANLSLQHLYLC